MPHKPSNAEKIIELCSVFGVSIFLDGDPDSDSARIGTTYTYYEPDKILTIYLVNIKDTVWEKLMPFLREKWNEKGIVLAESQEETLEAYNSYAKAQTNKDIIDFFSDKVPQADLDALKMSLFLRSESEKGYDISQYKLQIRERFGERGTYIANLCSSGYFEKDFVPYYNQHPDGFDRYYNLSVGRELKAIFVHAGMTPSAFREIFESKLTNARRYTFGSFKIHGFGSSNVTLIKSGLTALDREPEIRREYKIVTIEDISSPASVIYEIVIVPFE